MKRIKVNNFRKVKDSCEIELGPITFFTGPNNSGKSTILKALMLLSDYGKSNNHLELSFRGENKREHKIDCFQNAVNWDNFNEGNLNIEFSFDNKDFQTILRFSPQLQILKKVGKVQNGFLESIVIRRISDNASFNMYHLEGDKYQLRVDEKLIETRRLNESREIESLERNKSRIESRIKSLETKLDNENDSRTQIGLKGQIKQQNDKIKIINSNIKELSSKKQEAKEGLSFNPIFELPDLRDGLPVIDRIIRLSLMKYFRENEKDIGYINERNSNYSLLRISDQITSAINFSVEHLSPHRNSQTRLYINDEHTNDIYDLISKHSHNPIKKTSNAGKFIKTWMKIFDIGDDYDIRPVEGMASILEIIENGKKINLVDKGFGAGQVFTILLCIALKIEERENGNRVLNRERFLLGRESVIMIEEPEANLHPALQSKLAELFFDAYDNFGIRFILETHSEYILRKTQLLVKNLYSDNLPQELPFKVYYFDKEKGPYQMNYNKDGSFKDEFGKGFFDESSRLIFDLF